MSKNIIYGKGAPQKDTQARMGDIYRDELTNLEYLCIFAYRDGGSELFECEWTLVDKDSKNIASTVSNGVTRSEIDQNTERVKFSIKDVKDDCGHKKITKDEKVRSQSTSHKAGYTSYSKM